jgi:hypothetical protein
VSTKYVHWVAYPVLILIILWLFASSIEPAIHLDDMQQAQKLDEDSFADLLRYIAVNSACDKSPQQLAAAMGPGFAISSSHPNHKGTVVEHLAFVAKYEGGRLVGVEDVDHGSVAVCTDKRPTQ